MFSWWVYTSKSFQNKNIDTTDACWHISYNIFSDIWLWKLLQQFCETSRGPNFYQNEPRREKVYILTYPLNKDSHRPAHPRSRITVFVVLMKKRFASLSIQNAPSKDSDRTERMHRLVWIFAGGICPKVRFLMLRLKYFIIQFYITKTSLFKYTEILPPKNDNFQIKIPIFFIFLFKT